MPRFRRASVLAVAALLNLGPVTSSTAVVPAAPAGDFSANTVPRPPFDTGTGDAIRRTAFTTPDGRVSCRRVYTEMIWLECLLRDTNEIVRFGPDEFGTEAPCVAPNGDQTCILAFGYVGITRASAAAKARFAGARRVPLERLIELGSRTPPYPVCIADPNLGLSCSMGMDDSVGEQIYLGLAGGIWNCPGYEYIDDQTPIPLGHDRCRVVRP